MDTSSPCLNKTSFCFMLTPCENLLCSLSQVPNCTRVKVLGSFGCIAGTAGFHPSLGYVLSKKLKKKLLVWKFINSTGRKYLKYISLVGVAVVVKCNRRKSQSLHLEIKSCGPARWLSGQSCLLFKPATLSSIPRTHRKVVLQICLLTYTRRHTP